MPSTVQDVPTNTVTVQNVEVPQTFQNYTGGHVLNEPNILQISTTEIQHPTNAGIQRTASHVFLQQSSFTSSVPATEYHILQSSDEDHPVIINQPSGPVYLSADPQDNTISHVIVNIGGNETVPLICENVGGETVIVEANEIVNLENVEVSNFNGTTSQSTVEVRDPNGMAAIICERTKGERVIVDANEIVTLEAPTLQPTVEIMDSNSMAAIICKNAEGETYIVEANEIVNLKSMGVSSINGPALQHTVEVSDQNGMPAIICERAEGETVIVEDMEVSNHNGPTLQHTVGVMDPNGTTTFEVIDPNGMAAVEVMDLNGMTTFEVMDPNCVAAVEVLDPNGMATVEVLDPGGIAAVGVLDSCNIVQQYSMDTARDYDSNDNGIASGRTPVNITTELLIANNLPSAEVFQNDDSKDETDTNMVNISTKFHKSMVKHKNTQTDDESDDTSKKDTKLSCSYCFKSFAKNFDLQQHIRCHTGEKPFQCIVCGRAFAQKSNVKKHMVTHKVWPNGLTRTIPVTNGHCRNMEKDCVDEPDDPPEQTEKRDASIKKNEYACPYCEFIGKNYYELKTHMRHHEKEKVYKCILSSCAKTFKKLDQFIEHIKSHENELTYRCHECHKSFDSLCELGSHQFSHSLYPTKQKKSKRFFQCHLCLDKFTTQTALDYHVKTSSHIHKCDSCDKEFPCKRYLRRHLLIHVGDYSYKCEVCGKGFKCEPYLRMHRLMHTDEKSFKCDSCEAAFNRIDRLKRHMLIHETVKRLKCPFRESEGCLKEFNRSDKLKDHILTHSCENPFTCNICDEQFKRNIHLKAHRKMCRARERARAALIDDSSDSCLSTDDAKIRKKTTSGQAKELGRPRKRRRKSIRARAALMEDSSYSGPSTDDSKIRRKKTASAQAEERGRPRKRVRKSASEKESKCVNSENTSYKSKFISRTLKTLGENPLLKA